ncbi:MAG: glucokinase, partial [Pseudomonadota bacterium]|nr:glucokinase [Pseudomonadota bacterium]
MNATARPGPDPNPSALADTAGPPRPWLVADIGGTNARFGWLAEGAGQVTHVRKLHGADHPGVGAAASAYLQQLQQALGPDFSAPRAAAFAVATAVEGDHVAFTNSAWSFSRAEVQHR